MDLGAVQQVKFIDLSLGASTGSTAYAIQVSRDASSWTTITNIEPRAAGRGRGFGPGGPGRGRAARADFDLSDHNVQGRFVRIAFTNLAAEAKPSIHELKIFPARYEPEYFDVTYRYRLRWNDVIYEPGELKVVIYKQGAKVGEKVMRTAGPPASIRLTPDRTDLAATGEDLSFILVEAMDANGNPAPLADNIIEFDVTGAAELAGVDNGDQLSLDSFQDNRHALLHGKAMLIVRTKEGQAGPIQVTARSAGLSAAGVSLTASR